MAPQTNVCFTFLRLASGKWRQLKIWFVNAEEIILWRNNEHWCPQEKLSLYNPVRAKAKRWKEMQNATQTTTHELCADLLNRYKNGNYESKNILSYFSILLILALKYRQPQLSLVLMLHLLPIFNAWITEMRQQVCSLAILYNTVALHRSKMTWYNKTCVKTWS